jgi:hypothetical protein
MLFPVPVNSQNTNLLMVLCQRKFYNSLYFMDCGSFYCILPLPFFLYLLLTAIGLSPGGSSTVHIYTQTVHRTTQNNQYIEPLNSESADRAPSWLVMPWHLPYN